MSLLSPGAFGRGGSVFGETTTSMGLPWPKGHPGTIKAAASRLNAVASRLEGASGDLSTAAEHDGVWNAPASRSFAAAVRGLRSEMSRARGQLNEAAGALKELAEKLKAAQERVRDLDEKVRQAKERADATRLRADKLHVRVLEARRVEASGGPSADGLAQDSIVAERAAGDAEADFEAILKRAMKEAEQECREVLQRDKATAGVINGVAVSAPFGGASFQVPPLPTSRLANDVAPHYAPIIRHDSEETSFPINVPFTYGPGPKGKGIQLDYWPRYPDNNHWEPTGLSDHPGDFERVSVQLDGEGRLDVTATEAHGHQQGKRGADDMDTRGDQPVVYAGRGSHANYPEAGTNFTDNADFPSPDLTDGKGREVDTGPLVDDMRTQPELNTGETVDTRKSPVEQAEERPLPEDLDSLERSDGAAPEAPEPPPIIPTPIGPLPNPLR